MSDLSHKIIYTGVRAPHIASRGKSGIRFFHHPTIRVQYDADLHPELVRQTLDQECYIVFLSRNGVVGLNSWAQSAGVELDFSEKRVWAVGQQTAKEINTVMGVMAGEPRDQNARGLIRVFKTLKPRPVVLFCAAKPRPEFPEWLSSSGWQHAIFPVYHTMVVMNEDLAERFKNTPDETVIFTSPSTVQGFIKSVKLKDLKTVTARLVSIGPSTSNTIRMLGGEVYQEASEPDIDRLLTNIVNEMDK